MRIVFSSWQRTIWANIPTYPDKDDVNYIIDGCYHAGHYAPHYQVPALRVNVRIGRDWIDTVDTNGAGYSWNHPILIGDDHFYI